MSNAEETPGYPPITIELDREEVEVLVYALYKQYAPEQVNELRAVVPSPMPHEEQVQVASRLLLGIVGVIIGRLTKLKAETEGRL